MFHSVLQQHTSQFSCTELVDEDFPLHYHQEFELIIVNAGELLLTVDQKKYTLHSHDVAFVFSQQLHAITIPESAAYSIVSFAPALIQQFYMEYEQFIPENNVFSIEKPEFISRLETLYSQKSYLYGLCDAILQRTELQPVSTSSKIKVLKQLLQFIDTYYKEECTLKMAAERLQYDYAYLSKLFTQMTQLSFTEYLNRYRIAQAAVLLDTCTSSISEIAAAVGYNNLRNFNRNFRKIMKTSANNYRNKT